MLCLVIMVCRMLVAGFHKEDADDDHQDDDDDDDLYLHEACEKGWQPLKACCLPPGMMVWIIIFMASSTKTGT